MIDTQILSIHNSIKIKEGIKIFPSEFSNLVSLSVLTFREKYKNNEPLVSIVIPSYFRLSSLFNTLTSLFDSETNTPYEIIIFDNSFLQESFDEICKFLSKQKNSIEKTNITNILVYKDANQTFPTLRNIAFNKLVSSSSEIYASWDSDVLSNRNTIDEIFKSLVLNEELSALAPPMLMKTKAVENNFDFSSPITNKLKTAFDMPGDIGERIGTYFNDQILLTGILRGCFFLKKSGIEQYRKVFDGVFPSQFTVWSNVPFFLGWRELKLKFGYLYQDNVYVMNDNTSSIFSMGKDMNNRILENLKSIVLLCLRNELYKEVYYENNKLFNELTISHISSITGYKIENATSVFHELIEVAKRINSRNLTVDNLSDVVKDTYKYILSTVDIESIRKLRSHNPNISIYNTLYE